MELNWDDVTFQISGKKRGLMPWLSSGNLLVLLVLTILMLGCSRHQESGRLLASVSNSSLYMNEVASHVDTSSAYSVRSYVSSWVNQEILFDEAKKEGLDNSPEFRERVAEYSRQLAITTLLTKRVYGSPIDLTADDVSNYYNSHRSEFLSANDMVCVNLAAFSKREIAVSFRNALVSGSPWNEVFNDIPTSSIMDVKDSVYLTASSVHPAIWAVVQALDAKSISFPVQVDSLNYVVQVIKRLNVGESIPLDYAAVQIRERLTIEKKKQVYNAFLDSLRSLGNFQIDPSVAIRDTSIEE